MDTPDTEPKPTDPAAPKKVRIKAGTFEFEAEGAYQDYAQTFERFMQVIEKVGPQMSAPAQVVSSGAGISAGSSTVNGSGVSAPPAAPQGDTLESTMTTGPAPTVGEDDLNRVFRRDTDSVSLLALPQGNDDGGADALVLLLYGYQRLMARSSITGYALMKSARQSGINLDRIDKTMIKRRDYVLAAGSKRGRMYSLNNRGVAYAEGVLRRTLE